MFRSRLAAFAFGCAIVLAGTPARAQLGGEPPHTDLRLDLSQLYTLDDLTDRHISFSELRGTIDAWSELGSQQFEIHVDGRGRYGWTDLTDHRADITRAYVAYGAPDRAWTLAIGRQSIDALSSARVDGAGVSFRIAEHTSLLGFGGLMPHPISGAIDPNFVIGGLGYDSRTNELHHMGGVAVDLYKGALDRAYFTEQLFWRPGADWVLHVFGIFDLIAPTGFIGDLLKTAAADQSTVERIDLTNAHLSLRWKPAPSFDVTAYVSHSHTLLPNLWWFDYLTEQAARRGFVIDGLEPVGTRRSTARVVFDFHVAPGVTPYAVVRGDYRHEDSAKGYEGTLGVKLDSAELGYLDLSATARNYFGAQNNLAAVAFGTSFGNAAGIDATATGLRIINPGESAQQLLLDVGRSVWLDLKAIAKPLGDVRLMAVYQAFIDPEMVSHVGFIRVGYRFQEI